MSCQLLCACSFYLRAERRIVKDTHRLRLRVFCVGVMCAVDSTKVVAFVSVLCVCASNVYNVPLVSVETELLPTTRLSTGRLCPLSNDDSAIDAASARIECELCTIIIRRAHAQPSLRAMRTALRRMLSH